MSSAASRLGVEVLVTQNWNPQVYAQDGAFVPALAGGVMEWLAAKAGERILDLGCGDGKLTQQFAEMGVLVQGVDASAAMVEAARARGVSAEQGKAEALPFADGAFDAVFSNAVLHWVRDQDGMMAEVSRVLRPGGRFVAEMGGHGNIAAIHVALMAVLERHGFGELEKNVNYYPTVNAYTRQLTRRGFAVEQMALIPRPTPLGAGGMRGWLETFRNGVLDQLPEELRESVVAEAVDLLARVLQDEEGNWTADYVRLRFVARKPAHK